MERVGSPQDVVKGSSCEGESLCEGVPNTSVEQLLDALVVLESEVAQPQQPSTLMPRGVVLSSAVQDIAAGHERTAAASGTNAVGLLTAPQQAPASSSGAAAAMAVEQAGEQDGEQALFYDFRLDESGAQVAPSRPTAAKGKKRKNLTCACDFCRRRKIRCDGKLPCVHCLKRSQECNYSPQRRRGYRPKATKTSEAKEPARDTVTFYGAAAESGLSLSSVKVVLLDMYFRHFHRFSFNLVTQSSLTNPTNPSQELAQTCALALAARALRLSSPLRELHMRVNDQILSLAGEETLHVAKALGMAAAYYHGFDAESASEVSLVAKNIGESLMAKIPSCVALRAELHQLQLLLLSCCALERRVELSDWVSSLEEQMKGMSLSGPADYRTCDSKDCVELQEFTSREAPFGTVPLEPVLAMGISKTRELWLRCTKELVCDLPVTPVPKETLFAAMKDVQSFEKLWLSYSALGFQRPLSDFCLYAHAVALSFAANFYDEAAHYLYVSMMVLWLANQPASVTCEASLQRAPSWLMTYIRVLFCVATNLRMFSFASELVKLEYLLGIVTPIHALHCKEHFAALEELASIGMSFELPVLNSATTFAPNKLTKAEGGPGVFIKSFSELDPEFVAVAVLEPNSCLITTWLDFPRDDPESLHW